MSLSLSLSDIKTNMRHIHTSIVSRHLATRDNNKILRTLSPHISSSEEILPRLTRRTLAQFRTNKSPFLKSYLHKSTPNYFHHHYVPSVTLTHTTHIISSTAPTYAPHCHPAEVTALLARWKERMAGGPQAGTSDSPTNKGHATRIRIQHVTRIRIQHVARIQIEHVI